jgi:PEP-CTERM motif-containing protein
MRARITALIVTCLVLGFGSGVAKADVLYNYFLSGSYSDPLLGSGSFSGTLNFDATTVQFTNLFIRFTTSDGSVADFTNIGFNGSLGSGATGVQCGGNGCGHVFSLSFGSNGAGGVDLPLDYTETLLAGLPTTIDYDAVGFFNAYDPLTGLFAERAQADSVRGVMVAVPEPSTWAMLLIGFASLGFSALRRKFEPA